MSEAKEHEKPKLEYGPERTPIRRRGRKPKLNESLLETICDAISSGLLNKDACIVAGISRRAFYNWLELGRQNIEEYQENIGQRLSIYGVMVGAVDDALVDFKLHNLKLLQRSADTPIVIEKVHTKKNPDGSVLTEAYRETRCPDAKYAAWLLERKFPNESAQTQRLAHSGRIDGDGKPGKIVIEIVSPTGEREVFEQPYPNPEPDSKNQVSAERP